MPDARGRWRGSQGQQERPEALSRLSRLSQVSRAARLSRDLWRVPLGHCFGTPGWDKLRASLSILFSSVPLGQSLGTVPTGQRQTFERESEHAHCPFTLRRRWTSDLDRPLRSAMARMLSPSARKAAKAASLSSATMGAVVHWPSE